MQEYEGSIKEREQEIVSHQKTIIEQQNIIEEREKIIKEREKMIGERDLMIRGREQKIKDYENKIRMYEHKMHVTDRKLDTLERSNVSLVAILNEKETFCKENHKDKPKPRNSKLKSQPTSHLEMLPPLNMPVRSNMNGFQNESVLISPQQTRLVRNTSELAGNPTTIERTPSTLHSTFFSSSSPTLALLLTKSANTANTFSNTANTSISNTATTPINNAASTSISNAAPTLISNAAFTSIGNHGQTTRQHELQQILIQGPNLEYTLELDSLNGVSNSSTPTYPQTSQPRIAVSKNLYPIQPTTSSNSSGAITSTSSNVHTPHKMIPRQPERTKSVSSRPNQLITINQNLYENSLVIDENVNPAQRRQQTSQLRNRANTYVPGTYHNFDTNGAQIWQQKQSQHIQNFQQRQQRVSPQTLVQCTAFQQSTANQQPVFYCLGCYKTATLVCETCRNCCSCSQFCYDLIAEKHKGECIFPNMVAISNLTS